MRGRGICDYLGVVGRWSICGGCGRNTRWWISRSEGGKGGSVQIIGRWMASNVAWLTFLYMAGATMGLPVRMMVHKVTLAVHLEDGDEELVW